MGRTAAAWRGSTWERVCDECFGGDLTRMLGYAREYSPERTFADGDLHLGKRFREIVGTRNRTTWWGRARELLEELVRRRARPPATLDVGPVLEALRRGEEVRVTEGAEVIATLVPRPRGD